MGLFKDILLGIKKPFKILIILYKNFLVELPNRFKKYINNFFYWKYIVLIPFKLVFLTPIIELIIFFIKWICLWLWELFCAILDVMTNLILFILIGRIEKYLMVYHVYNKHIRKYFRSLNTYVMFFISILKNIPYPFKIGWDKFKWEIYDKHWFNVGTFLVKTIEFILMGFWGLLYYLLFRVFWFFWVIFIYIWVIYRCYIIRPLILVIIKKFNIIVILGYYIVKHYYKKNCLKFIKKHSKGEPYYYRHKQFEMHFLHLYISREQWKSWVEDTPFTWGVYDRKLVRPLRSLRFLLMILCYRDKKRFIILFNICYVIKHFLKFIIKFFINFIKYIWFYLKFLLSNKK